MPSDKSQVELFPHEGEKAIYLRKFTADHQQVNNPDGQPVEYVFYPNAGHQSIVLHDARDGTLLQPEGLQYPLSWIDAGGWAVALLLVLGFGALMIWGLFRHRANLSEIISEPDGKASLSRFQALVFTFAFTIGFLLIVLRSGSFPAEVPWPLVAILAGSLGTYLYSKHLSQGAAAEAAGAAATGRRLLWFDPGTITSLNLTAEKIRSAGPTPPQMAEFALPVHATEPSAEDYQVIAVTTGETRLTITPKLPVGRSTRCRLRYVDAQGNSLTPELSGPETITTYAQGVSEVAAAVVGENAGELVKIEVRAA